MAITTFTQFRTKERTGAVYTATIKDSDATVIPLANLTTITLTLYDLDSGTIINSRNGQDVKNTSNVTIHASSGLLTWTMQALDNAIISTTLAVDKEEKHRAMFEYVFTGNGTPGKHVFEILVMNLDKVP